MEHETRKMDACRQPTVIFLHIPKAAGSTLHTIIERQYPSDTIYTIDPSRVEESVDEFKSLPVSQRRRIRVLKGHMSFGLHRYLPGPTTYITILRDPVDRIVSHYHFVLRSPTHYLHDAVKSKQMTLAEYAQSALSVELDNHQTRMLAGTDANIGVGQCSNEMLELAKKNLREHFSVVAIAERFDEMLIMLRRLLGWKKLRYVKRNVGGHRLRRNDISDKTVRLIREYNKLDVELYDYAVGMFDRLVGENGGAFSRQLRTFKVINKSYNVYHQVRAACVRRVQRENR